LTREVRQVLRKNCRDLIIGTHYAARWPSVSYAFGLYVEGELEGVVTYGTPASATLRDGLAGKEYGPHVLELNRLVLKHNRKNDASFLVSASLRKLKAIGCFIVISFADTEQGHAGIVYQACNFSYHGLSAKRTDWKIRGMEHLHGQTISDKYRGVQNRAAAIRADYGDDFYLKDRPRKHRYIKIVGNKGFVAKATRALKYPALAYPCGIA
jgi:hypothetical protein